MPEVITSRSEAELAIVATCSSTPTKCCVRGEPLTFQPHTDLHRIELEPRNLFVYRREGSEAGRHPELSFFFETPDGTQLPANRELLEELEWRCGGGHGPVRRRATVKEARVPRSPLRKPEAIPEEADMRFGRICRSLSSAAPSTPMAAPSSPLQFDMDDL